jgi:hypothetical protein
MRLADWLINERTKAALASASAAFFVDIRQWRGGSSA